MIAVLSVDGSAIAGRSAAVLHGLTGFKNGVVETIAPVNASHRNPVAVQHRFAGALVTTVAGIPVTTVAQTLLDLSPRVAPWPLERAMDDGLLERKVTVAELDERLAFYDGSRRSGLPRIRPLIVERRQAGFVPPESALEASLATVLDRLPSSPLVVRQAELDWLPQQKGRVDFYLPDHRLVIEADGRRWHNRVADFDRDLWRDNRAVANGHCVMRFTWVHLNQLTADVVDLVEQTIARARVA